MRVECTIIMYYLRCKAHAARVDAVRVGGQVHRTGAILDPGGADMNETKQVH